MLEQKKIIALALTLVLDVLLIVISVLSLGPTLTAVNNDLLIPQLALYLSPLAVAPIVLLPTDLVLRWVWPARIDQKALLFPLRLALAYEFLHGGIEKLTDTTYLTPPTLIHIGAAGAPSEWVRSVMTMMLGNFQFFLLLIAYGELLVGASLLLGGFVRLGAIGGALLQLTFMFLLGWLSVSTFGLNFIGAMAFLALGMYQSGRFLGIDARLGPYLERSKSSAARLLSRLT